MSRRAVVFLGEQQIARMLALPEGIRMLAARDDFQRCGVNVLVEGEQLDDQPPAGMLPDLPLAFLDRTELAMRAGVSATWCSDGTPDIDVWCPLRGEGCDWSRTGPGVTLALLADVVQQHLAEVHP